MGERYSVESIDNGWIVSSDNYSYGLDEVRVFVPGLEETVPVIRAYHAKLIEAQEAAKAQEAREALAAAAREIANQP